MYYSLHSFSCRYSPEVRADIGKYTCQHGMRAASTYFSRKLGKRVSQSFIQSIKVSYLSHMKESRGDSSADGIDELPPKKRGRPLLLGTHIEKQLRLYLQKIRENGGVVRASVVVAVGKGIMMSLNHTRLAEFGDHITLNRHWACHFLGRMKFVRRKATSKSRHAPEDFAAVKKDFLEDNTTVITMEDIPPDLVFNWDQTGIHLVPASTWTMDKEGSK